MSDEPDEAAAKASANHLDALNFEEKSHLSALVGPGHEIVSVQKKQVVMRTDEVLMVNGTPISLEGKQGDQIKECLLNGRIPNQDLINHLLMKAGLFLKPVKQVMKAEITVSSLDRRCESAIVSQSKANPSSSTDDSRRVISQGFSVTEETQTTHDSKEIPIEGARGSQQAAVIDENEHSNLRRTFPEHLEDFLDNINSSTNEHEQYSLLLWSRLYVTPNKILTLILNRVEQTYTKKDNQLVQALNDLLSRWITWFPEDFAEEAAMQKLRKIFHLLNANKLSKEDQKSGLSTSKSHLLATLSNHLSAIKKHQHLLVGKPFEIKDASQCINLKASDAAKELTRIELEYLCFLAPSEFINVFAKESSGKEDLPVDVMDVRLRSAMKTKGYDAYIQWFNHLSFLVATSVCKTRKKKVRVKVIEFWIEVARMCVNIGNFNSLMGIITGLNMFPVARLRKTWSRVQPGKFTVLEHQMDPTSNFLSYRSTLTAALVRSESATDDVQKIIIPFFSLFVKDLYTAKEEIQFRSILVDVKSFEPISKTIREFSKWKNVNCPFERSEEFHDYLKQDVLDEEGLDFQSFQCEQPKMQCEQERYKTLKEQKKKSWPENGK